MNERELLKRITMKPDICFGKPTVRGLRYPVEFILEMMSSEMTTEEILDDYPDLEIEDLKACCLFASKLCKVGSITEIIPIQKD